MRLAIVNLTSGGLSGGYLKYLRSLLPLLEADSRVTVLSVFLPDGIPASAIPESSSLRRFSPDDNARARADLRARVLETKPDVVFIPTSRWLDFGAPTVVMVRNMEPLAVPFGGNSLIDSLKNVGRRLATRRACRSATAVIAVSRYVENWLFRHWSLPASKTAVIYHGVAPARSEEQKRPPAMAPYSDSAFIFTAGSIRPARGLEDLIGAFSRVAVEQPKMRLVIAGGVDRGAEHYHKKMLRLAERLGVAGRIVWLGSIPPAEMNWCFANAAIFVTTSRAEACPNTVLEAMASGALIVSGENPPMPEFLQSAAFYYKSGSADSLYSVLRETLTTDRADADSMRQRAASRASEFTWARTADETITFLDSVFRRGRLTNSPSREA